MRPEVKALVALGALPNSKSATMEQLKCFEEALRAVTTPLSPGEAEALAELFGPDDCFGLAWTFLHLIESAPGWRLPERLACSANDWHVRLRQRMEAGRNAQGGA